MLLKTPILGVVALVALLATAFAYPRAHAQLTTPPIGASPESDKNIGPSTDPSTTADKKLKKSAKPKKTKKHHRKRSDKSTAESMSGDDVQRP